MKFFYRIKQLALIGGDTLSFVAGFWIALTLRNLQLPDWEGIKRHLALFAAVFAFWIVINYINGLYDLVRLNNDRVFYRRFVETAGIALIVGIIFFYLLPAQTIAPKTILLFTVVFGYGISFLWRMLFQLLLGADKLMTRVIFVGYTEEMYELLNLLIRNPKRGYDVVACVDPTNQIRSERINHINVYKSLRAIRPAITTHKADLIVMAPHLRGNEEAVRELYELLFWPVEITDLTSFYELITGRIPPSTFSESWFLDHIRNAKQPLYDKFRVIIDYLAGLTLGGMFLLLVIPISIGIKMTSKGPVFFKQKRVGKYGKRFDIYKFRSMYALSPDGSAEIDKPEFAKKNDKRTTSIGKWLRKLRFDELPQCLNILRGEITLIGPRPERPEIVEELHRRMPYYPLRHVVKPGLTSWAVLHQDYTEDYETSLQKLQYDLYYIKNRSFLLDLSILLRTVNLVLRLKGQ
jgi:exopolysaccharide biosynthesis polyprenyl glycosylphosphotransferase